MSEKIYNVPKQQLQYAQNMLIANDNKQKMRKLSMDLNGLHLRNLQIVSDNNTKRTHRGPNSNRTLMKLFLSKQILEECLETIDIFKEIMEDTVQKNKLIRDVTKNIKLKLYDQEGSIYDKGDVSESIYLVIKGEVSLCLPCIKETATESFQKAEEKEVQYDYKEIDIYKQGVGFGQAEFIHGKKRGLAAKAKQDGTVVGSISADGFEQIIELYRQRVYYKKIEMFTKCALLKHLQSYQLQFIVNNAKPFTFPISKQIISSGEKPKALYLITNGQIELRREQISRSQSPKRKLSKYDQKTNSIVLKKVVVGVLEQGEFFGDCQLALNTEFNCNAVCKSQKVKMWICDQRIIMSQISPEMLDIVSEYYLQKNEYREQKIVVYKSAKSRIQKEMIECKDVVLNQNQLKIKRKINNRYVQKNPSIIGHLSPREIKKMVDLKYAKLKTEPSKSEEGQNVFPLPSLHKSQHKKLARNERANSPLLKKLKQSQSKDQKYSKQKLTVQLPIQNTMSVKLGYVRYQCENDWIKAQRSSTRPLLVLMKPFHKKVKSLHERLTREFNQARNRKRAQLQQIKKIKDEHSLSISQMRRLTEFISKIQSQNKTSI